MSKISAIMRRADQQKRQQVEQERRKAEDDRIAAIEERSLKHALGGAVEQGFKAGSPFGRCDIEFVRRHPSDAGRKRPSSPAGEVADKGRKWGGALPLPGSYETGKEGSERLH